MAYQAFKDVRKRSFLNAEGADKPLKSPLPPHILEGAQTYRLSRIRQYLKQYDCTAGLFYDPVNIHYATGSSNMQVWTLHNAVRYVLVFAEGPTIMFEFKGGEHLCRGLGTIDEIRPAVSWLYMTHGNRLPEKLARWAAEIASCLREHGGGNKRLAIDRLDPEGHAALHGHGIVLVDGPPITEHARAIKSADEIALMRWTIRVCEAGMARIYEHSLPGVTEQELWAHLHFENARSGGEWLET